MPPLDPRAERELGQTPARPDVPDDQEPGISPTGEELGGVVRASPEEQEEHERVVGRAMELIYSDGMFEQVVTMLEGGAGQDPDTGATADGDPVKGLAVATEMIVSRVADLAARDNVQITPDVLYHAGADILEELAEVSRRGRIKDYSQDPDALESAWFQALDMFRERLAGVGELDEEGAKADLERLVQMDQNGTLEKIMRGLAEGDRAGQAGPAGGPTPPPQERKPRGLGTAAMGR